MDVFKSVDQYHAFRIHANKSHANGDEYDTYLSHTVPNTVPNKTLPPMKQWEGNQKLVF
jgi:hypothetical protein